MNKFMSKKNLNRNVFRDKTFKIRNILAFLITISILSLSAYFIYNNSSSKKILANNGATVNDYNTKTEKQENYDVNNKNSTQNISQLNKDNVINDNIGVPVLYYHSINDPANNEVILSPKILREQLQYLKDQGYKTITINELKNYLLINSPIPQKSILITFDDGYMDNYSNAFPILKELNMTATIFCITSDLDGSYYLSKEAIKEMSQYGIDFESHTVTHPHLDKMAYDLQLKELKESKKTLEAITGKEVISIAYPFGDFNDDTVKAAKAAGYTLGFTTKRGLSDRNDAPLKLDRIYISSKYNMETFKEVLGT